MLSSDLQALHDLITVALPDVRAEEAGGKGPDSRLMGDIAQACKTVEWRIQDRFGVDLRKRIENPEPIL